MTIEAIRASIARIAELSRDIKKGRDIALEAEALRVLTNGGIMYVPLPANPERVELISRLTRLLVRYRKDDTTCLLSDEVLDEDTRTRDTTFALKFLREAAPLFPGYNMPWRPISELTMEIRYGDSNGFLLLAPELVDDDCNAWGVGMGYWQDDHTALDSDGYWLACKWSMTNDEWSEVPCTPTHYIRLQGALDAPPAAEDPLAVNPTTRDLMKPRGNDGVVSADICCDALCLVDDACIPIKAIEDWTQQQRDEAYDWAMRVHLRASDNDDVYVPPRPSILGDI